MTGAGGTVAMARLMNEEATANAAIWRRTSEMEGL